LFGEGLVGPNRSPDESGWGMDKRLIFRYFKISVDGATKFDKRSGYMVGRLSSKSASVGKSAFAKNPFLGKKASCGKFLFGKFRQLKLPRKPSKL